MVRLRATTNSDTADLLIFEKDYTPEEEEAVQSTIPQPTGCTPGVHPSVTTSGDREIRAGEGDGADREAQLLSQLRLGERSDLPACEICRVEHLVRNFVTAFAADEFDMGLSTLVQHQIRLLPLSKPVKQKPRREPIRLKPQIEAEIQRLLRAGCGSCPLVRTGHSQSWPCSNKMGASDCASTTVC